MSENKKKKLSVIFAFYNDAECINSTIKEMVGCLNQISKIDYEIIEQKKRKLIKKS